MAEQDEKKQEGKKLSQEEIKKEAEKATGRSLSPEEVQQFSQAYAIYYRKIADMTEDEIEQYKKFLAKTSEKDSIEGRYEVADQLFEVWKNKQSESTAEQDGDKDGDEDDVGDRTTVKHQQKVDADATPPGVEHETNRSGSRSGDNVAPKQRQAPLADDDAFFNALKNFSKSTKRLKTQSRVFKTDAD